MRRRVRVLLVIGLAVAVGATAGAVVFRESLFEALLTAVLRSKGVPAAHLSVVDLGWSGSRIDDVRLGQAGEITARSLRLDFSPSGLLAGRLDRVAVDGLTITLDLTGDGPPLGSLQPLLSGGGGGNGAGSAPLPPISLTDIRIAARTPAGMIRAAADGRLETGGGETTVEMTLQEIIHDGEAIAAGRFAARLSAARADATLALHATAGGIDADASAVIDDPFGAPVWRLNVMAKADAASPVWGALVSPAPQSGRAKLTVAAEGRTPPRETAAGSVPLLRLLDSQATGTADLTVTDVSMPDRVTGLDARARLAMTAAEGVVTLRLPEDATLAATHVSPAFLQSLGLPIEIADQFGKGVAARLTPPSADQPVAIASRDGDLAVVALDGTLALTVPDGIDLSLTLPADIRAGGDRVSGRLRGPAELRLKKFRYGGVAELLAPAVVALSEAEATVGAEAAGDAGVDYRVTMNSPALRLRLHQQGANTIDATVTPGRITATPGGGDVTGARVEMPAYRLVADGLSVTVQSADNEINIDFQAADIRQTGAEAMFAPITMTGQANRKGEIWQGTAVGKGLGGVGRITAKATHDGATALGQAHVILEPLVYKPGGAQPGALVPVLSVLQETTGTSSGEADLSWTPQGMQGAAALSLADLSFTAQQTRVEGLNLDLRLDSLLPPASPPGQTLTVRRLEPGLPLDRLDIRFQIQPTDPPSLAIETAQVFFGSGRFTLADLVVDPAATRQRVDLRVQDLSLAELFAILGLDGLSGDGRLSGTIPMDFTDGNVVIENGRLAADAPGTIRFRSEQAAQILADQGESLDLVLRALEDFRYDELTVDLEKSADDVGRMKLSLLGKNPAVLEGYPFRFNISVEANTGKLITALTTIYQVPNDLLRRAWTSGR